MNLTLILLTWISILLATCQANKYASGSSLLAFYQTFKGDFLTAVNGVKRTVCPALNSKSSPGQMPTLDEFAEHVMSEKVYKGWNSQGKGGTTNPSSDLGYKELRPKSDDNPFPWMEKGVPSVLSASRMFPDIWKKSDKQPNMGQILSAVVKANQETLLRANRPGVFPLKIIDEVFKNGVIAAEGRWRDTQDYKIPDFNAHFKDQGIKAVTYKRILSSGEEVDGFDVDATARAAESAGKDGNLVREYSIKYGTASALDKDPKSAKSHALALQYQTRSNMAMIALKRNPSCKVGYLFPSPK